MSDVCFCLQCGLRTAGYRSMLEPRSVKVKAAEKLVGKAVKGFVSCMLVCSECLMFVSACSVV